MSTGKAGLPPMAAEQAEWIAFMEATGASPATIKVRTTTMRCLLRSAGKTTPLDLQRRDVLKFLARPIKPWTKTTYWRCIRSWDQWALEFGYIHESIVKGIPQPKTPTPVARPIDDHAVMALLAAPLSQRARAYVLLALYQALRVHEIAKIRGEDFDHAAGWLTIKGKGGSVCPIPIHPRVAELAASFPEQGYWFPSQTHLDRCVEPQSVSVTIKSALRMVGVRATAHQLRDTAATRLQRQVKDIRLTQAFLRHSSVATTQKYVAVSDTALQAATQAMTWQTAA